MITALDVYLVMQADAILDNLAGVGAVAIIISGILGLISLIAAAHDEDAVVAKVMRVFKPAAVVALTCVVLTSLIPNSRTIAAMVILPALTKPEVMEPLGEEAKELYELAKEAMRDLLKQDERTEEKEAES